MLNDEIQKLIRCVVEAGVESNVSLEEIQEEIAHQFKNKLLFQACGDVASLCQAVDAETFRKKAERFIYETFRVTPFLKEEKVVELFCIFHELKQKTPTGELVDREELRERLVQACNITANTASGYFSQVSGMVKQYLRYNKGISLKNNVSINLVLDTVYPYVLEM